MDCSYLRQGPANHRTDIFWSKGKISLVLLQKNWFFKRVRLGVALIVSAHRVEWFWASPELATRRVRTLQLIQGTKNALALLLPAFTA